MFWMESCLFWNYLDVSNPNFRITALGRSLSRYVKYHDCKNSLKQLLFVKDNFSPHKSRMEMGCRWSFWKIVRTCRITYNIQSDFFSRVSRSVRFVLTIDCWWCNKYCHVQHKLEFPYFTIQQIARTENVFSHLNRMALTRSPSPGLTEK